MVNNLLTNLSNQKRSVDVIFNLTFELIIIYKQK